MATYFDLCRASLPPAHCLHRKDYLSALQESLRVFACAEQGLELDSDAAFLREEVGAEAEAKAVAVFGALGLKQRREVPDSTADRNRFRRLSQSLERPSFEVDGVYSSIRLPRLVKLLECGL